MLKVKKNLIISSIILASSLAGCTTIPDSKDIRILNQNDVDKRISDNEVWSQDPSVQVLYSKTGTQILKRNSIPEKLKEQDVSIRLMPDSTVEDLLTALSLELDVSTIVGSEEISNTEVYIPNYNGTVENLLDLISSSKDISFDYNNGSIIAKESSSYVITLPQDQDLMDTVTSELGNIGARDVQSSVSSGSIFYNTTLKHQEKIESYLDRIVNNSSLITLQVMVINVNTDRERQTGFDWSSFQAELGDIGVMSNNIDGGSGGSGGNGGIGGGLDGNVGGTNNNSGNSGSSSDSDDESSVTGELARITGNSLGLNIARDSVNISGLFNLLSTYGNTRTNQDVSLKTISGKEVTLDSFQEIPYVSDVNLSTTDTGVSNSGLDTETVKNGLTMNFLPYYEAESKLVSVDIGIELETLLGFVELSGGDQLGTITQPRTQRQAFNNTIRIPVGETVILGGVTYESISDNRNTLSFMDDKETASQNEDISSNSLFVVIRPTVILYKNVKNEDEGDE